MVARILIADDNSIMRTTLRSLLEGRQGWQVCYEASNGLEAVQGAATLKPDLVILDLSMPVMDGLQAAREISSSNPDITILMHTNHASAALVQQAEKHGIRKVVSKGGRGNEIVAAIEALLSVGSEIAAGTEHAATIETKEPPALGEAAKAAAPNSSQG